MPGPVFRTAGARAASASAATIAPAKPTVDGAHGLLLCVVTSKNNAAHATATPGWSQVGPQVDSGVNFTASLWLAAESAAAPTFTWTGAVECSAQIVYYSDPTNSVNIGSTVVGVAGTGSSATHASAAISTDVDNALAVYVDVAAANTGLSLPTGWTEDSDTGSATDAGETVFGSKVIATSGTSSGAISVTGANAAWVQWQLELKGSTPAPGFEASLEGTAAWVEPATPALAGFTVAKEEVAAWVEPHDFRVTLEEVSAWVEPQDFRASLMSVSAWLDKPIPGGRRMSLM